MRLTGLLVGMSVFLASGFADAQPSAPESPGTPDNPALPPEPAEPAMGSYGSPTYYPPPPVDSVPANPPPVDSVPANPPPVNSAPATPPPPGDNYFAPPMARGFHTHDGFFLRTFLGASNARFTSSENEKVSGWGGCFGLDLGFAVIDNLILFAELSDDVVPAPSVTANGAARSSSGTSAGTIGFGFGASYYIMPLNLYLSGTLIFPEFQFHDSDNNVTRTTQRGVGANLMVGKEWWVSYDWGLGIAGQALFATMNEDSATWTALGFGIAFSATYN